MRIWTLNATNIRERRAGTHIVMVGDVKHGFMFYGPFKDFDEANHWVDVIYGGPDCAIVPLEKPLE